MTNFKIFMCQQISLNLPKNKFHGTALKNAHASWMQTDRVKHRDVLLKVLRANRAKLQMLLATLIWDLLSYTNKHFLT